MGTSSQYAKPVKTRIYVIAIALIGLALRLFNLGTPKGFVFDELYYVDGARDYLAHGVEVSGDAPEFVVHPPVGKWLLHSLDWRLIVFHLKVLLRAHMVQGKQRLSRCDLKSAPWSFLKHHIV